MVANFTFYYTLELYIISFYFGHMLRYIQDRMTESKLYLWSKLMFFIVTKKYSLECVFVYKLVSFNVSLFSIQACCIFYTNILLLNTV